MRYLSSMKDYQKFVSVVAQLEEGPVVTCTPKEILDSDSPPKTSKPSIPPVEVDEFALYLPGNDRKLTRPSAGCRKSLFRLNTHSNCSHYIRDIPQK